MTKRLNNDQINYIDQEAQVAYEESLWSVKGRERRQEYRQENAWCLQWDQGGEG